MGRLGYPHLYNHQPMESIPVANTGQHLEHQIAEPVGLAHVHLAGFLVDHPSDEIPLFGVRSLQQALALALIYLVWMLLIHRHRYALPFMPS